MLQRYMESEHTAAAVRLVEPARKQIEARGPLSSLELEEDTRMDWWLAGSVRAVRIALDILLYGGQTIVHHRVGTRRYFELTKRVLPSELMKVCPPHGSQDDYLEWHVFRRAGGLGLVDMRVTAKFGGLIGWQDGRIKPAIVRLAEKGQLVPVTIEELPRQRLFIRSDDVPALSAPTKTYPGKKRAAVIAPLDNLLWDLKLIETLFDFRYTWEVYKPADKRDYGYYVLPVLYGDRFVARIDPAFDRASRILTVKNWWWEREVNKSDEIMLAALGDCLRDFATYLDAKEIRLGPEVKGEPGLIRALER
jgi:uncharacterized protein